MPKATRQQKREMLGLLITTHNPLYSESVRVTKIPAWKYNGTKIQLNPVFKFGFFTNEPKR